MLAFRTTLTTLLAAGTLGAYASPALGIGLSSDQIVKIRQNLLQSANLSWELGTATQTLLELDYPLLSAYSAGAFPPPRNMSSDSEYYPKDVFDIVDRVVSEKNNSTRTLIPDGATGDPASLGIAVLIRNWTRTDRSNNIYSRAGGEQVDYLLHQAPVTADGAISQREDQVQLWSDFVFMVPPFMAYFGATFGGEGGDWLMMAGYNQSRLYRQYMRDDNGLWRHIVLGTWQDNTHWATGNAWAAAGMMRVQAAIEHSASNSSMKSQQQDLLSWVGEIVNATWAHQQQSGAVLNEIDASNATASFEDTAATALLAAVTFRHAAATHDTSHVEAAKRAMLRVVDMIDDAGWLRGTVDPYTFNSQLKGGGTDKGSPEGQAFVLMMHAAWRDYLASLLGRALSGDIPTTQPQTTAHSKNGTPPVLICMSSPTIILIAFASMIMYIGTM